MSTLQTRRLGRTGWQVTELGLGCFQFTGEFQVPREEAERILDLAFESGINFFDTAAMYGYGESEELLGRALRKHGKDGIYVATKVGWLDRTVVRHLGDEAYRDAQALLRAIKHSMWTLQLDCLDALMVHEPGMGHWGFDLRTGDAVVMDVLEGMKRDGTIAAIGLGGWNCDVIAELLATGRFDVALVAGGVTLLAQPIRSRVLPAAREHDVGIILGAAMRQRSLVVKDRPAARAMIDKPARPSEREQGRKLLALYELADEAGVTMPDLTIRYVLSLEYVHTHVAGAREASHLASNLKAAAAGPLPAELAHRIERIAGVT